MSPSTNNHRRTLQVITNVPCYSRRTLQVIIDVPYGKLFYDLSQTSFVQILPRYTTHILCGSVSTIYPILRYFVGAQTAVHHRRINDKVLSYAYTPVSPGVTEAEGAYTTEGRPFLRMYPWWSLCTL